MVCLNTIAASVMHLILTIIVMRNKSYQVQPTNWQRQPVELLGAFHVPRCLYDQIQLDFDVHGQGYTEILRKLKHTIGKCLIMWLVWVWSIVPIVAAWCLIETLLFYRWLFSGSIIWPFKNNYFDWYLLIFFLRSGLQIQIAFEERMIFFFFSFTSGFNDANF